MTASRMRLAVLVSGRGSNLQAIIDACAAESLAAEVVSVHSDRSDCVALTRARAACIAVHARRPGGFDTRRAFDQAMFEAIDAARPDLIVCAGYMRLIDAAVVDAHRGRLINIHPSLLPAFKGLHTHRQALDARATEHGASVHYVTPDLDGGPVIAQARLPVAVDETEASLAARVLDVEHPLLVESLRWLADGRIALTEDRIQIDGRDAVPLQLAANHRFA